jgi:hypothetical protein
VCVVCGRLIDGGLSVSELRVSVGSLRACREECRGPYGSTTASQRRSSPRERISEAARLKDLYEEICRAVPGRDLPLRDVAPILLKLVQAQCNLLWVAESTE